MAAPDQGTPPIPPTAGAPRSFWRAFLPFLLTTLVAVGLSISGQIWLIQQMRPVIVVPTALPTATPPPTALPTATSLPLPPPDQAIVRQELADLRAEQRQLWTAIYLSRALNQIADAETVLDSNDLNAVEQALLAVDDSLSMAYERADSSVQTPIEQLRREIDSIRDDLFLYPEQIDARLTRVRQFILTLIERRN